MGPPLLVSALVSMLAGDLVDAGRPSPIIGGAPSEADPAVVSLVRDGRSFCTGSLIAGAVVVTAAHCVVGLDPGELDVRVDDRGDVAVTDVIPHPEFDRGALSHDIAILGLGEEVDVAPVALPSRPLSEADVGARLRVVGYGRTAAADLHSLDKQSGIAALSSLAATTFRLAPDPAQTCMGDSGGPALLMRDGVEELIGVTSGGDIACMEYGVDTRVDVYVDTFVADAIDELEGAGSCRVGDGSRWGLWIVGMLGIRRRRREPMCDVHHSAMQGVAVRDARKTRK